MEILAAEKRARLPRFQRADEPPPFRLTDGDMEIIRQVARHRLIRSTQIAALVGRSLDRTNDRLMRLFHAGYLDRPRAQLDRFPTSGTAPMVYALADRGARLLCQTDGALCDSREWSRRNREAGRPFIEHQLEIVNFQVALRRAVEARKDLRLIEHAELIASAPAVLRRARNPFALRVKVSHRGQLREATVIPDFVFGLALSGGTRRYFMVEIDRGTMPVRRSDPEQTSFEVKMRVYLAAHAAKQHERQFGWKNFRALTVTTDRQRMQTMMEAAQRLRVPQSIGATLFLFSTFEGLRPSGPLAHEWLDGSDRTVNLI